MFPFKPYNGEQLAYYQLGFAKGYVADASEADPFIGIPDFARDVYAEGLADGAEYGACGFPIEPRCFQLVHVEHSTPKVVIEGVDTALELYGLGHVATAAEGAAAGIAVEGALLALMVSIALMSHTDDPQAVLNVSDYASFTQALSVVGDPVSVELYFGCGIDLTVAGCEMQATMVYKSLADARAELDALGRPVGMVLAIRTDMSGFNVVDHFGG